MSDTHHDEGSQAGLTLMDVVLQLRSDLKENGQEHKELDRKIDRLTDHTNARIDDTNAKIDRLMDHTNARIDDTNAKIDRLTDQTNAKFDKTNAKIDRLMYVLLGGCGGVILLLGKMAFWPVS